MMRRQLLFSLVLLAACSKKAAPTTPIGDTHETTPGGAGNTTASPEKPAEPPEPPPPPRAPVTFVMQNDADKPLTFALDKGWGTTLFAYTGTPPKATSIIMFPRAFTGACDGSSGPICPEQPKVAHDPRKAQAQEEAETQRQEVEAGKAFELEWDGQVLVYEKAPKEERAKNKRCECYKKVEAPAGSYTVKACGLRTASQVGKSSKIECVESTMTLPASQDAPQDVKLVFTGKLPDTKKGK